MAGLVDQQKDDNNRLTVRLTGTEKQRDDALEALVLQQEIAEELERERKRNKKELAALEQTNNKMIRQRDEARRVVLHLRSLIGGQSHHMEHLVRSLTTPDEMMSELGEAFDDDEDEEEDVDSNGMWLHVCQDGTNTDSPLTLDRLTTPSRNHAKRVSAASFKDVADRHLKDKTDAIAHIIRNISEQCQAAVEGLQLAHDADSERLVPRSARSSRSSRRTSNMSLAHSEDGSTANSEAGDDNLLHPSGRFSSIPPTPDLIPNRSSTSMSYTSTMTTPERSSQQYHISSEIPTKILEDDEDLAGESDVIPREPGLLSKHSLLHRSSGARISAFGGTR